MTRNITTGYFGLINNCFLKAFKDKLYVVQDGVFYIRSELILDSALRQSTEKELENLLHREYTRYLLINKLLTSVLSILTFYTLTHFLSFWSNILVTTILTVVVLFSRRQFIEEWKTRMRSILLFIFDYLELLEVHNRQAMEYNQVASNTEYLHGVVMDLNDNYNELLKYLRSNHPRIFNFHAQQVEARKTTKDVYVVDYTDKKYMC